MSSQVMSPRLAEWDESYFRGFTAPPGDVLVWPSGPAHRANTAKAAALAVSALGGIVVATQAMVTGSIPLPMALEPAFSVVPPPATGSPAEAVVPGPSEATIQDSPAPALVHDSDIPVLESSAGHHAWQPPRLADRSKTSWSDTGHRAVPEPRHGSRRTQAQGTGSWPAHRPDALSTWANRPDRTGRHDAGAPTDGRPEGGRHRADHGSAGWSGRHGWGSQDGGDAMHGAGGTRFGGAGHDSAGGAQRGVSRR